MISILGDLCYGIGAAVITGLVIAACYHFVNWMERNDGFVLAVVLAIMLVLAMTIGHCGQRHKVWKWQQGEAEATPTPASQAQ